MRSRLVVLAALLELHTMPKSQARILLPRHFYCCRSSALPIRSVPCVFLDEGTGLSAAAVAIRGCFFCHYPMLKGSAPLPFVIPTGVEGSAVPRTSRGDVFWRLISQPR